MMDGVDTSGTPLWLRVPDGQRGPRPRHSLDEIAASALRIADADGLDALSMRRLASDLRTGPASLYRYVAGKADLDALLTDRVVGEYDYPALTGSVTDDVVGILHQVRASHRRHPWLTEIRATSLGPNAVGYLDRMVAATAPLGADAGTTLFGIALLTGWAMTFDTQTDSLDPAVAGALVAALLDQDRHPHLAALMASAADAGEAPMDVEEAFRRGVTSLLAGIGPGSARST